MNEPYQTIVNVLGVLFYGFIALILILMYIHRDKRNYSEFWYGDASDRQKRNDDYDNTPYV